MTISTGRSTSLSEVNASGTSTTVNFSGGIGESSSIIEIEAGAEVNMSNFQTYGALTLDPATATGDFTLLTNVGTTPLGLEGGSTTLVGIVASPSTNVGINLNGHDIQMNGAELKNDGIIGDLVSTSTTINVEAGSLFYGNGITDVGIVTSNGGTVRAGDCPGLLTASNLTFGPGGAGGVGFQIDDAAGVAGPTPDATGHVDGWSLMGTGNFSWTADADHPVTISLQSLSSTTTLGHDVAGAMDNFDPTQSYSWAAVKWTGTYTGPTDVSALNASTVFDTSGFANSFSGTFSWSLDTSANTLYLTYTPD